MAPVLAYWKIRGLAQPIRLLLHYTETEFEDKTYEVGDAPDYSRECWLKEKESLGLDFPNLPYYLDGDIKLTQSNAILRHIARKHNLCGKMDAEEARVDMAENQLMDFRNGFVRLCYNGKDFETYKPVYLDKVKDVIKKLADFLGERKFISGEELTFVDFVMYELLDQHRIFESSLLEIHGNLKDYLDRIEALPSIAKFMKSDKFIRRPINNKIAAFF